MPWVRWREMPEVCDWEKPLRDSFRRRRRQPPLSVPGKFPSLSEAASALAALLSTEVRAETDLVVGLGEAARGIAEQIAGELGAPVVIVPVERGDDVVLGPAPECAGLRVLVVDRGVETGQSALLAARALKESGATWIGLAVPVCPRQAEAGLVRVFDEVIAVHRPLARRSLQWHYATPLE